QGGAALPALRSLPARRAGAGVGGKGPCPASGALFGVLRGPARGSGARDAPPRAAQLPGRGRRCGCRGSVRAPARHPAQGRRVRPNPRFLQALGRTRLNVGRAVASAGTGERRSRAKGAGLEFADFRLYAPGDDTRHLDARLHARLGDYYVREFEVHKQLPVTVVVDASRSMGFGTPEKLAAARWLANVFGYLALAGGDKVQVAFWNGSQTIISPGFSGVGRAQRLFEWVERQQQ